jgi:GNAT superfamily N-acetyltransferase
MSFDADLLRRVEDAGLNASAPPQQRWIDGWIVRFNPGKAKRARCINAVAAGVRSWERKLDECAEVYRHAGLPMLVRVTPFTQPPELDQCLERRGWHSIDDTRVMVCPALDEGPVASTPAGMTVAVESPADFARTIGTLRGSSLAQVDAHAARLAASPVPHVGWVLRRDGEAVACAQAAQEGDLVGLYDVFVAPRARGAGLARWMCEGLLKEARTRGAKAAYLQVDADNAPARTVYRALRFADAYWYSYRSEKASAY